MVLEEMDVHMHKEKIRPLSFTAYKDGMAEGVA